MGSIHSSTKLKIKCPKCEENLFGYHFSDSPWYEDENITYCKKCGFRETLEETENRLKQKKEFSKEVIK